MRVRRREQMIRCPLWLPLLRVMRITLVDGVGVHGCRTEAKPAAIKRKLLALDLPRKGPRYVLAGEKTISEQKTL